MDWTDLRTASLRPGGFGVDRVRLWPQLLHAVPAQDGQPTTIKPEDNVNVHADEHQIRLDTNRSFVLYPTVPNDKNVLQEDLYQLIMALFQKRPNLSYFQGYHDIVTVLFLTLPRELQLPCIEQLSLHRVRDSMCSSLEPVLGLLRILQRLLRLADSSYAQLLEKYSHFPYFALPNLLTLFSHDMPTLPLIQHVFDYLLCRPPIIAVYLVAAVTLSRKAEVLRLEEDGEEGMLHSLLSALPNITDEVEELVPEPESTHSEHEETQSSDTIPDTAAPSDGVIEEGEPKEAASSLDVSEDQPPVSQDEAESHSTATQDGVSVEEHSSVPKVHLEEAPDQPNDAVPEQDHSSNPTISITDTAPDHPRERSADMPTIPSLPSTPRTRSPSPSPNHNRTPSPSPTDEKSSHPRAPGRPTLTLTSLLTHADQLYETYPPSHPSLSISSIMGPQSVIFTWSETRSEMPSDFTAERIVEHVNLIVYPEPEPETKEVDTTLPKDKKRRRRKLHKRVDLRDKKTMVAGALLVLGVAMAVYGVRSAMVADTRHGGNHHILKEWKKVTGWVGGLLLGASERFLALKSEEEL